MKDLIYKQHENVLQADELSRAIYSCSMTARKIIAFASTKLQEKELGENAYFKNNAFHLSVPCAEFKISSLLKALNLSKSGEAYEQIKKAVAELRHCSVEIKESDDEFRIWNWFQYIRYSKQKDLVELHFSDEIGWALIGLKDNYCSLDLHTVGEFKSFYAFRYYEIALSWIGMKGRQGNPKGCWWFQMSEEELRATFKIDPISYKGRIDNFIKYVITKPIEELNSLCSDFQIEVLRVKRGRELVGFRFNCTQTSSEEAKKIVKTDSKQIRQEKREINEAEKEIDSFEKKYPDEFARALEEVKKENELPGIARFEVNDRASAVALMKKWGLKV